MANLAPARCGVTATPRAFQTCPWQISFASPRTIWHASFVLTELQALADRVFAAAALDCSAKSRAREIPRDLGDGKPGPRPWRSDRYPEGLPDLPMADQLRVSKDNLACSFVLTELQALADRGGGSVRENPLRSLHSKLTQEKQMMGTGPWQDTVYSACCFMGARWGSAPAPQH